MNSWLDDDHFFFFLTSRLTPLLPQAGPCLIAPDVTALVQFSDRRYVVLAKPRISADLAGMPST